MSRLCTAGAAFAQTSQGSAYSSATPVISAPTLQVIPLTFGGSGEISSLQDPLLFGVSIYYLIWCLQIDRLMCLFSKSSAVSVVIVLVHWDIFKWSNVDLQAVVMTGGAVTAQDPVHLGCHMSGGCACRSSICHLNRLLYKPALYVSVSDNWYIPNRIGIFFSTETR